MQPGNGRAREPGDPRPLKERSQHYLAVWMDEFQWQRFIRCRELVRWVCAFPWRIAGSLRERPFGRIASHASGDDDDGNSCDAHALLGISPQRRDRKRFALRCQK